MKTKPPPASIGENRPDRRSRDSDEQSKLVAALDLVIKAIAAGAVVYATVIANRFQASVTAASLLSQREQGDSTLRAGMLHDLVDPIVGSQKSGQGMSVEQEQLLVELLALNFHEHFELKPLMLHVDARLARDKKINPAEQGGPRESLKSVARRVQARQLALLTEVAPGLPVEQQACVYFLDLGEGTREQTSDIGGCSASTTYFSIKRNFEELITVPSPNRKYRLALTIEPRSWEDQSFFVQTRITPAPGAATKGLRIQGDVVPAPNAPPQGIAGPDFVLTWFDFPFTDNTLLADGSRFAVVIDRVTCKDEPLPSDLAKCKKKTARFKLIWFPQDYFSERERPVNYRQLRDKLGLGFGGSGETGSASMWNAR